MKLPPFPHYYVNEVRFTDESDALRRAREIADDEDEAVRVFIKVGPLRQRQLHVIVQPQSEMVPA